jgi:polyhydroxyalkanoate synthesis regulator phasin
LEKAGERAQEEVESMSVLKKVMLLGIGAATVTREKAEELVEDLVKRGEVAAGDKAKAIDELQHKAEAATAEIKKLVDERLDAVSKKLHWLDDMRKLEGRVEALSAKVDALEKALEAREGQGN